jgi:hypothetical protein
MSGHGPTITLVGNSSSNGGGNHHHLLARRQSAVCLLCVTCFCLGLFSAQTFPPAQSSVEMKTTQQHHPTTAGVQHQHGTSNEARVIMQQTEKASAVSSGNEEVIHAMESLLLHHQPGSFVVSAGTTGPGRVQQEEEESEKNEEVKKVQPVLPENEPVSLNSMKANETTTKTAPTSTTILALLPPHPDLSVTRELQKVIQNSPSGGLNNPLLNCSATSQVRISSIQESETGNDHYWMLESLDGTGQKKTIGGDEFYISYLDEAYMNTNSSSHHPTAVAFVRDQQDGTYRLDFVTSPFNYKPHKSLTGHGLVMVSFQYTCGIGSMTNHTKDSWKHGGTSGSSPTVRLLTANVSHAPPMRIFKPPPATLAFNNFSNVHVFGDSTMCQLVGTVWDSKKVSHRSNNYTNLHHCTSQLAFAIHPGTAISAVGGIARGAYDGGKILTNDASTALILGAGAWDLFRNPYPLTVEGPGYTHLVGCQMMVEKIRELFPNITLIWRSMTAMHIHAVALGRLGQHAVAERVRYLSTSRAERLYRQQKALMEKLNVTFLDVYEATYLLADYTQYSDALHYTPVANARILAWLYPNYHNGE